MKRIFQIIPDVYDNKLILYLSSEKRIKMVFPRFIKTYIIPIFNTKYLDIFKRLCLQKKDRALFHLCHIFIASIFLKHTIIMRKKRVLFYTKIPLIEQSQVSLLLRILEISLQHNNLSISYKCTRITLYNNKYIHRVFARCNLHEIAYLSAEIMVWNLLQLILHINPREIALEILD